MFVRYTQHFVVAGTGPFPLSMLQHDRCYPATEEQTNKILFACDGASLQRQFIRLTRQILNKAAHPDYQAWLDHGWKVEREWMDDERF